MSEAASSSKCSENKGGSKTAEEPEESEGERKAGSRTADAAAAAAGASDEEEKKPADKKPPDSRESKNKGNNNAAPSEDPNPGPSRRAPEKPKTLQNIGRNSAAVAVDDGQVSVVPASTSTTRAAVAAACSLVPVVPGGTELDLDAVDLDVITGRVPMPQRADSLQSPNAFPFPDPPQHSKPSPTAEDPLSPNSKLYVLCCSRCLCLSTVSSQKQKKFNPKKLVQGVPLDEIRSWGNSFEGLMRHESGRRVFSEFLRHEHSEENLLFWSACEDLKKETDDEKLAERARVIYKDYISILSPREVSLDARVRELINQRISKPTPEIFKEAQAQIFILMKRDSYPRFLASPIYMKVAHYKHKKAKLKKSNSTAKQ